MNRFDDPSHIFGTFLSNYNRLPMYPVNALVYWHHWNNFSDVFSKMSEKFYESFHTWRIELDFQEFVSTTFLRLPVNFCPQISEKCSRE